MIRLLVSFHYHRKTDLAALVKGFNGDVDLFADSGAYSAYTSGAEIKIEDYTAWLRDWDELFTVKASLDVIGDPLATARNLERIPGAMPVFHPGTPWDVLERLCRDHPYIALGGVAGKVVQQRAGVLRWLVRCFQTGRDTGTVFHGFGLTSLTVAKRLPFYSLDSSSWRWGVRHGMLQLWDTRTNTMASVHFRDRADVTANARLLRDYGLSGLRLVSPRFLNTPGQGGTDRGTLLKASAEAYRRMERSLAALHAVTPPPLTRYADPGTKVYLAVPDGLRELTSALGSAA